MPDTEDARAPRELDVSRATAARMYDYYLGGKDNFAADREAAEAVLSAAPEVRPIAVENRRFLQRAVRYLAREAGIRQFLDLGTGLPTQGNVHEIAQAEAPDARVVYVDSDPIVLVHARALLAGTGTTAVLTADLRDPETVLGDPQVRSLIDFDEPVAVLLAAVLHFVPDVDEPHRLVRQYVGATAPGSHLLVSHVTGDTRPASAGGAEKAYRNTANPATLRSLPDIERFFDGLELVEPGVVPVPEWRPDAGTVPAENIWMYGGVARKP
ncbi:SAM-dependent methyltransferase [Actinomadura rayongensis]|uniref:SAM-dependent methyltransferase n=1 Tax=Actinomadura rayongensis TaxID=1429076 RepID=A0A6I4WE83_9ACTN|nr:SAM-dependent methyltransferase [Actinomadura rayongensis]MXQ68031.1 SAM-dependent methyltransferase [Actinomadura rayongensis]